MCVSITHNWRRFWLSFGVLRFDRPTDPVERSRSLTYPPNPNGSLTMSCPTPSCRFALHKIDPPTPTPQPPLQQPRHHARTTPRPAKTVSPTPVLLAPPAAALLARRPRLQLDPRCCSSAPYRRPALRQQHQHRSRPPHRGDRRGRRGALRGRAAQAPAARFGPDYGARAERARRGGGTAGRVLVGGARWGVPVGDGTEPAAAAGGV